MRARSFFGRLVRHLPAAVLALLAAHAAAQSDPPGRVARLNLNEGSLAFSPAGDTEWTDAVLNRPLTRGDRLWTDRGSRAELHAGAIALRMNGQTLLAFLALDDHVAQLSLSHGAVQARLRELAEGENFQLDTPNLSLRVLQPGDYRVDVDPERATTRVTVHSGTAMAYGENGQALPLGGGQQVEFRGRALAQVSAQEAPPLDVFDRWAGERDRREDQSVAARYLPREVTGYQQLDAFGKWTRDATLGPVWQPRDVDAAWIPFRYGRWDLVAPWGWTWIDEAPWGFATTHYGRWTQLAGRWAWVPGRIAARPVYSPALVGFIGNGVPGDSANPDLGSGRRGVAWFPLAPGEAWKPGYKASPVYVGNINRGMTAGEPSGGAYAHRRIESVTAVALDDFLHGRPVRARAQRLALGELSRAPTAGLPPAPGRALPQPPRLEIARVTPPPAPLPATTARPAASAAIAAASAVSPAAPPASAPRQLTITRDQVQHALQVQREQARQAAQVQPQRRTSEQDQAKVHAQARPPEQEQAKAQAQAKARLAKAQREKLAREQAQREALAKRKLQLQQEQTARQAQVLRLARLQKERKEQAQREQVRREALAAEKAQEQARHDAHVRRLLGMAETQARARREEQEREEQKRLQAQREAQQREQLLAEQRAEQRRREQLERRLQQQQQEAQQRQAPPFLVTPPYGMPVWRGGRS